VHGYQLAFDLATANDRWLSGMLPMLILPALGLVLVVTPQRIVDRILTRGPKGRAGKAFALIFFLSSAGLETVVALDHFSQLRAMERNSSLAFVEGCLQGFHPMPASGHDDERVQVRGIRFSYSDYDESTPAFNNTESHGGPIHADSAVKIWYAGNSIVKLAVSNHACPNAPDIPG
jgi:hypothetical protein